MFSPELADRRFGTGLSPIVAPPSDMAEMLNGLSGPDDMARDFPIPHFANVSPSFHHLRELRRVRYESDAAAAAFTAGRGEMNAVRQVNFAMTLARGVRTPAGFRERLTQFWADHFTAIAKNGLMPHLVTPYVEDAIRPNMIGQFADLLFAAVTHPMMVIYLDQAISVGPNSRAGLNNGRGLNENLAREVLELHTLGVDGSYSQADVRELAEVFTGLSWSTEDGRTYRPQFAEPGAETVLGTQLSPDADLSTIVDALTLIAEHPDTARHIAGKLAVHFVADRPDPKLILAMADTYLATSGNLMAMYQAMLAHPSAWETTQTTPAFEAKVMRPFDFIQSSLRALNIPVDRMLRGAVNSSIRIPLRTMGQDWERPPGPDGWAEDADAWVTPQGMAGRITWAMNAPSEMLRALPDPREFVRTALGPRVPEEVAFAARAAEDRATGIGLILSSAAFQRRS